MSGQEVLSEMDSKTRVPGLAPARNRVGVTQVALAEMLGVHHVTVARWETGEREPDIKTLNRLANLLGVTVQDLVASQQPPTPAEGAA